MASEFAENDGYGYLNMAASYFNMVAGDPYMKVSYLKRAARQPNRGTGYTYVGVAKVTSSALLFVMLKLLTMNGF